jgi:hypothetical protein
VNVNTLIYVRSTGIFFQPTAPISSACPVRPASVVAAAEGDFYAQNWATWSRCPYTSILETWTTGHKNNGCCVESVCFMHANLTVR